MPSLTIPAQVRIQLNNVPPKHTLECSNPGAAHCLLDSRSRGNGECVVVPDRDCPVSRDRDVNGNGVNQ